uniref:Uncharacterized protein n=1 Tax=Picea glauca TaxID=3330 RepID=A0A117NH14_PICGL|nr:hypothetical protein ABT39_MTgene5907 [Picea glauca]QHR92063.1 hypothetical protein Q903MT_gene6099 [Picea sitchensis]
MLVETRLCLQPSIHYCVLLPFVVPFPYRIPSPVLGRSMCCVLMGAMTWCAWWYCTG